MNKNYVLELRVTGDGKLAVRTLREIDAEGKKAGKSLADALKPSEEQAKRSTAALGGMGGALGRIATVAAGLKVATYLKETADNATLTESRIKLVTRSLQEQMHVQEQLLSIANQNKIAYADAVGNFPRIARAVQEYGGSTNEALKVTKAFSEALRISGRTQAEAAAVALQFAQALASGRLAGDELRSVLEGNERLSKALADGLGVGVGELKRLGEEGELTSQRVVNALLSQSAKLESESKSIGSTIAGGWTVLWNEMDRTVASSNTLSNAQKTLAGSLELVAGVIKKIRDAGMDPLAMATGQGGYVNPEALARAAGFRERSSRTGATDLRRADNELAEQAVRARAAAERTWRDTLKDGSGEESIYAKFDKDIRSLARAYEGLTQAGGATAAQEKVFQAEYASIMKQRTAAIEELQKKGTIALSTQIAELKKRSEAQRAAAEAFYTLESDSINRVLSSLEFYHRAGLQTERDYLERRSDLREGAAKVELSKLNDALKREQALLAQIQAKAPRDANEVIQQKGEVEDQKRKILELTTQQVIAERNVTKAVQDGKDALELYDIQLRERLILIQQSTEEYQRGLREETDDLKFQIGLFGKSEVAQKQLIAARRIEIQLAKDLRDIEREIELLKRTGGDPEQIKKLQEAMAARATAAMEAIKNNNPLIDQLAAKEDLKRFSDSIADALVDGCKSADIWRIIQAELTRPLKLAISAQLQSIMGMQGFGGQQGGGNLFGMAANGIANYFGSGQTTPMTLDPYEVDMGGSLGNSAAGAAGYGSLGVGIAGMAGSAFGGWATNQLGTGERGQQVATMSAGTLAAIGMSVGGPIGAVIGAVIGTAIGHFTDPDGLANRTAEVGTDPNGQYSYSATSAFGTFGTSQDHWFSDDEMGDQLRQFFTQQAQIENALSRFLTADQRASVTSSLNTEREYNFGMEHGNIEGLTEIMRDRLKVIVEAALPGLGHLVEEFQGTAQELANMVDGLFVMRENLTALDAQLAQLGGDGMAEFIAALANLKTKVDSTRDAFDAAVEANDPVAILSTQQELLAAVNNRYNSEMNMIHQLVGKLEELSEASYQFEMRIGGMINAMGGSRDLAGIAMNRAMQIRSGFNSSGDPTQRVSAINNFMGAIQSSYDARRAELEKQIEAQQASMQAQAQAQQAIAQARISALQTELQLAQQWVGVLGQAQQMLQQMKFSSVNPLGAGGRYALARNDSGEMFSQFQSLQGQAKIDAATKLLPLLQTRLGLLGESQQRPSGAYQAGYNEITSMLSEVEAYAKTQEQKAIDLQTQILTAQTTANNIGTQNLNASIESNALIQQLNAEYREQLEWAEREGMAAYEQQERLAREQLEAITGGMDVDLYIAQRQNDQVQILTDIRDALRTFMENAGRTTTPTGTGTAPNPLAGNGTGIRLDNGTPGGDTILIYNAPGAYPLTMDKVRPLLPQIKKELKPA